MDHCLGSSVYDSNGNTGTSGQVLSSVPGIGVSWTIKPVVVVLELELQK